MTKTQQHRPLAALNPAKSVHDVDAQAKSVVASMTGNGWFKTPNPSLATVLADIAALESAETVALTKLKGAASARNVKLRVLLEDLHHLKAYVQLIADADPTNAEAIILSSGMSVKKTKIASKQAFDARQGTVSGSAHLIAKAAGRASYEWQVSIDEKSWTSLPITLQAHTVATNLTPGTTHYFRHRTATKKGVGDWSQVVSLLVK